jgi:hypothetical protein
VIPAALNCAQWDHCTHTPDSSGPLRQALWQPSQPALQLLVQQRVRRVAPHIRQFWRRDAAHKCGTCPRPSGVSRRGIAGCPLVGSPLGAIASSTDKGRMEKKPRVGGWTWHVALAPWGANRAANPSDSDRARGLAGCGEAVSSLTVVLVQSVTRSSRAPSRWARPWRSRSCRSGEATWPAVVLRCGAGKRCV